MVSFKSCTNHLIHTRYKNNNNLQTTKIYFMLWKNLQQKSVLGNEQKKQLDRILELLLSIYNF